MAEQWQIRRGNTTENNDFTGAQGELTMDTQKKGLRVHDGTTQGGIEVPTAGTADYVVEWQAPNAGNNYTWYRKYKSGWVEQGGLVAPIGTGWQTSGTTIILPIEMANDKYYINWQASYTDYVDHDTVIISRATTSFTISRYVSNSTEANWEVKGMAA